MFKKILKCDYSVNGAELSDLSIAAKVCIIYMCIKNLKLILRQSLDAISEAASSVHQWYYIRVNGICGNNFIIIILKMFSEQENRHTSTGPVLLHL